MLTLAEFDNQFELQLLERRETIGEEETLGFDNVEDVDEFDQEDWTDWDDLYD